MIKILKYIENYGIRGFWIYLKLIACKHGLVKTTKISVPNVLSSILVRHSTSDYPIFNQVFRDLEYDIEFGFEPKNIIDAGANIGLAALYFASKFSECKIVSIEPELLNFEILKINTNRYSNILPIQKALSNSIESLIVIDHGLGTSAFTTEKRNNDDNESGVKRHEIETTTIPEIMKDNNLYSLDVVKIDIEGFEKELFESGFEDWVPYTKVIIVELHDRMKEGCSKSLFNCMIKYDFELDMNGENLIFTNLKKPLRLG